MDYMLKRWRRLTIFLDDGRICRIRDRPLEVGGFEAFREPAVDRREQVALWSLSWLGARSSLPSRLDGQISVPAAKWPRSLQNSRYFPGVTSRVSLPLLPGSRSPTSVRSKLALVDPGRRPGSSAAGWARGRSWRPPRSDGGDAALHGLAAGGRIRGLSRLAVAHAELACDLAAALELELAIGDLADHPAAIVHG
jgi:hypothetical protein